MLEKAVPRLLPDLGTDRVFSLLRLLEELGHLLETRIRLFLLLLGLLNVIKEQLISLIINFLSRPLGLALHVSPEIVNPIYFLFRHSKYMI